MTLRVQIAVNALSQSQFRINSIPRVLGQPADPAVAVDSTLLAAGRGCDVLLAEYGRTDCSGGVFHLRRRGGAGGSGRSAGDTGVVGWPGRCRSSNRLEQDDRDAPIAAAQVGVAFEFGVRLKEFPGRVL